MKNPDASEHSQKVCLTFPSKPHSSQEVVEQKAWIFQYQHLLLQSSLLQLLQKSSESKIPRLRQNIFLKENPHFYQH